MDINTLNVIKTVKWQTRKENKHAAGPVGTASAHFCNKVEWLQGYETVPLFNTFTTTCKSCVLNAIPPKNADFHWHSSCPPYMLKDV